MKIRIRIFLFIFFSIWTVLLVKIYYLSIKSNTYYEYIAQQNAQKIEYLLPLRGVIRDKNGTLLAANKLGFSICIKPHLNKKSKREILEKTVDFIISYYPDLDKEKLLKAYKREDSFYNHEPITVVDFIPYKDMLPNFTEFSLNENIKVSPVTKRFYPYNDLASHIIGYVAKANKKEMKKDEVVKRTRYTGKTGLEKYYNTELEGTLGYHNIQINAYNEEVQEIDKVMPSSKDIKLSLDIRLQNYISKTFKDISGVIIVMNAKNGEILSAVSFPEYDLNIFVNGISKDEWDKLINDPNHGFINKISKGLYPPGSTIKMASALAFLNSGIVDEKESVFCTGEVEVGKRKFRCWNIYGHGRVDLNRAIRESCDDYFYKQSLKVGINNIAPVYKSFGFGKRSGIDLPNEFIGTVPSRKWKKKKYNKPWFQGETLITVIGQGNFLVTPIQIARYTALLATGKLPTPHFVTKVGDDKTGFPVYDVLTPIEREKLPLIQKAMYEVCNNERGTAYKHIFTKIKIAGKTGTAQVSGISQKEKERIKEEDLEYYKRSHAWLTTYGPYDNPKFVVTALIEHGGHGGSRAGPIVSKIYNKLIKLGYIKIKKEKKIQKRRRRK